MMMVIIISWTQKSNAAWLEGGPGTGMVGHQISLSLPPPLNTHIHFQIPWGKI